MNKFSSRWTSAPVDYSEEPRVNRSIVAGLTIPLLFIFIGIASTGEILRFIQPISLLLILGGTVGATLVQFSVKQFMEALQEARATIFDRAELPSERMKELVRLSHLVKDEGVLALEREALATYDPFMRLGLQCVVDAQPPADMQRILENEMKSASEHAARSVQVFESMGNYSPAIGLIGTLIGLIQMLGNLSDPSVVGPSMAMALVATLYGAVGANLIFFPISGKLRMLAAERAQVKALTLEGLQSVAREENPIILQQKLQSFSPLAANG